MSVKIPAISLATLVFLAGCGGGSSSTSSGGGTSSSASSVSATDAYPTGLAIASPTALVSSSSSVIASLDLPFKQRVGDWWEHLSEAVNKRNAHQFALAMNPFIPIAKANAAPAKVLESQNVSSYIQRVVRGEATPDAATLPLDGFFKSYTSAPCYGPQVAYFRHDDGTADASPAILPGGDVGMWLNRNGDQITGTPCAAAQLNALMDPIKSRANASLMLGARMVALAVSGSGLPAANSSSSLTTSFQSFINGILPSGTTADVTLAGITNNGSDSFTYQWRVKFTRAPQEVWLLVNLTHQKTSSGYTGLLQYATSELRSNTQATAECSTSKKLAVVGTVRYNKSSATQLDFSAREAPYCITASADLVTDFGSWVSVDSNKELDPTKTTNTDSKGWHQDGGGFKRFAASFTPDTGAGNYLFAWQAGIGDSNSRMFAVNSAYNSSSEARTLRAFFGFAPNMAATSNQSQLGQLICNWAGPGHNRTVVHNRFQSQLLSLTATATDWFFPTAVATDSKIRFAPTNSCDSSSTMNFDVDAGGLAAGEGASFVNSLDILSGTNLSVFEEIKSRGFSAPSMY
jgi:hypothetical protein